jgi:hypothetical protein
MFGSKYALVVGAGFPGTQTSAKTWQGVSAGRNAFESQIVGPLHLV